MRSPSLGAYFASKPIPVTRAASNWNVYATPAAMSLGLLLVETGYLAWQLPETRGTAKQPVTAIAHADPNAAVETLQTRQARLRSLGRLHGAFLLFFSGVGHSCLECQLTSGRIHPDLLDL